MTQRKRRQFLRGFQPRPADRARHAAHRDGRRYEPVHGALRLALRRAVVGCLRAKHRLPDRADRRHAGVPHRARQDGAGHFAQRHRQSRLRRYALSEAGLSGDTLSTTTEIIGLKENSNRKNGTVYVRSTGRNQRGEPVLDLLPLGDGEQARRVSAGAGAASCRSLIAQVDRRGSAHALPEPQARKPTTTRLPARRSAGAITQSARRSTMSTARPSRRPSISSPPASSRTRRGCISTNTSRRKAGSAQNRLWRPRHLHREELELQRARQCLPSRRHQWRAARCAELCRRHHLCLERGHR